MPTIVTIPVDCIIRILEIACEPDADAGESWQLHGELEEALPVLIDASHIAPSWAKPAQRHMWRELFFHRQRGRGESDRGESAVWRVPHERVEMWLDQWEDDGSLEGVLAKLSGIESLRITGERRLEERVNDQWLNLPSLRDLKTLSTDVAFLYGSGPRVSPNSPLRLRTLTIGRQTISPTFVQALLSSPSAELSSLTLERLDLSVHPALLPPLLATHLSTLSLRQLIPGLAPLLSTFTSLTSLTISFYRFSTLAPIGPSPSGNVLDDFLDALHPRVDSLALSLFIRHGSGIDTVFYEGVLDAVGERIGKRASWRRLKTVKLGAEEEEVRREEGGDALLQVCAHEGVEVIFVGE